MSVLLEIQALLPVESLLYAADSAWAPYGSRPAGDIITRSRLLGDRLVENGAKAIIIACNTATAVAADTLRRFCPVPVIAMEPAIKPAAAATRNRVIGVLATAGTLASVRFAALLQRYARDLHVVTQPCPGLVEAVEGNRLDHPETGALLDRYLAPLVAAGADTIILGCTHYPFLRDRITQRIPPDTLLIDTGAAVARQVQRELARAGMLQADGPGVPPGRLDLMTTGDPVLASAFLDSHGIHADSVSPLRAATATVSIP